MDQKIVGVDQKIVGLMNYIPWLLYHWPKREFNLREIMPIFPPNLDQLKFINLEEHLKVLYSH